MEFRIFFPLPVESDESWMPKDELQRYTLTLQQLTTASQTIPEKRTDSYFVTPPFFGLKYRHGSKLEIKVRNKDVQCGIEKWSKHKLGKKEIDHYKSDIGNILVAAGYDELTKIDHPALTFDHQIAVEKSRQCAMADDVLIEVCEIVLPEEQPNFPLHLHRRRWLSVAVEGSSTGIEHFLTTKSDDPMRLKQTLNAVNELLKAHQEDAIQRGFIPIVSGYPMFLHCVSGKITPAEMQHEVVGVWNDLMNKVAR